ncbi:MAG: FecR domain-containing protein [Campylobacterota bacterium]|nr:FecR domain-containing protein [Campylobacterota bacterium]
MKLMVLSIIISMFSYVNASAAIGSVELFKGTVKIKNESSIKKNRVTLGQEVLAGDMIISSKNASVKLKLTDGSVLILDEKSTIHFSSLSEAEQVEGKVLYKITSRDSKNSLKVKTPFAIIGIKGTTFIINATENSSVSLQEGLIGVSAIDAEFELYRKKVQKEFDDYLSEQDLAFEEFKNEQDKYAIAEPTKEFDLEAGNKISFNGLSVNEDAFDKDDNSDFEYFEALIKDMTSN